MSAIRKPKRPAADTKTYGAVGIQNFSGIINEEWLNDLKGLKAYKKYAEMRDNSAVVGASLEAIRLLALKPSWYVLPGGEKSADQEAADFLRQCLHDMETPWKTHVSEVVTMEFGWALKEICYKQRLGDMDDPIKHSQYDDGRIGWRDLPFRKQETIDHWDFDENQALRGWYQRPPPDYLLRYIPVEKFLLFKSGNTQSPEGRSILRNAYRSYYFLKHIENYEAIGIEKDATGMPVLYLPENVMDDATLRSQYETVVKTLKRGESEGIMLSGKRDDNGNRLFELQLLGSSGPRQFNIDRVVQRKNTEIAQSMLTDFIQVGHEGVGSYALAADKHSIFADSVANRLEEIKSVMNTQAIPRLFELNDFQIDELPKLAFTEITERDLQSLGTYLVNLSNAGMTIFPSPDGSTEKYLLKAGGLPEPKEEDIKGTESLRRLGSKYLFIEASKKKPLEEYLVLAVADKYNSKFKKKFIEAANAALSGFSLSKFLDALKAGNIDRAMDAIAWDDFEALLGEYKPLITYLVDEAGQVSASQLTKIFKVNIRFDLVNQGTFEWISNHSLELIKDLNDTSRSAIRGVLTSSFKSGVISPNQIAKDIQKYIGLDEGRIAALEAKKKALLDSGISLRDADLEIEKLAAKSLSDRAQLIATNETLKAAGWAQYKATKDAVGAGLIDPDKWEAYRIVTDDDRLCDFCAENDGETRELPDGVYPSTGESIVMAHINCRCQEGIRKISE